MPSAYLQFSLSTIWSCYVAGKSVHSNQYSLTEYYSQVHKGEVQLPAIYFLYDLSPIMVVVKDNQGGLAHLLVRICAVVGGVFAVTGVQPCLSRNFSFSAYAVVAGGMLGCNSGSKSS